MLLKITDIGNRDSILLSYIIIFSITGRVRVRNFFDPEDAIGFLELCVDYITQLYVKFDFFGKSCFKI